MSRSRPPRAAVTFAIVLAPLVFFGWMLGGPTTLGNDYPRFQVDSALSLRFYTARGIEPMWYPHLGGGMPIGGLMLAQYFHGPAWLLSLLPGYGDGYALEWITVKHLLLWMLLQAIWYRTGRGFGLGRTAAYLLSFVGTYNARNLDAFRYGPGLDATVYGEGALLVALGYLARPRWPRLLLLVALAQLLLTSGYPVLIPFLLIAAAAGVALVADARRLRPRAVAMRLSAIVGAGTVAALLAAPALAAVLDFLEVNDLRISRPSLEWASAWAMTPWNPLLSAVFPWSAEVSSALSGSTFFFAALTTLVLWSLGDVRRRFFALLLLAFPFTYALGSPSIVFRAFHALPLFASLRVPGRILTLVPLLALFVLIWARARDGGPPPRALRIAGIANAALCALALAVVLAHRGGETLAADYSPIHLAGFWSTGEQAAWLLLGIAAALAFARAGSSRPAAVILVAATVLQTALLMRYGTWIGPRPPREKAAAFDAVDQLPFYADRPFWADFLLNEHAEGSATTAYTRFFRAAGSQANCYLPLEPTRRRKRGVLLPFYLSADVTCTTTREDALALLKPLGGCRFENAVHTIVTQADCTGVSSTATPADLAALNARNRLVTLTPNRVRLQVEAPRDAVLVTPFPDAGRQWSAAIDGAPASRLLADGGFLGLRVPAGAHAIDIDYFSTRLQLGFRLFLATLVTLALAGTVAGGRRLWPQARARTGVAAVLVALAGLLAARHADARFASAARADVCLHNLYREHLDQQIRRWRGAP